MSENYHTKILCARHPTGEQALAVLMLLFIYIAAGLVARTGIGRTIMRWSENSFLGGTPAISPGEERGRGSCADRERGRREACAREHRRGMADGYLLELLENGWVAVFLPQAPTPMSGNVMYLAVERERLLAITMVEAMSIIKHMGIGSAKALRTTNLALPKGT